MIVGFNKIIHTYESWITFFDDVVQAVLGLVLVESFHGVPVLFLGSLFQLSQEHLILKI